MYYVRLILALGVLAFASSCGCKLWPRVPSHRGAYHGTTARAAPWDLPCRPPAPHAYSKGRSQ